MREARGLKRVRALIAAHVLTSYQKEKHVVTSSCLDCTIKHLGAAIVLHDEYNQGYKESGILLIGHLHEAARECGDSDVARRLRAMRKSSIAFIVEGQPLDCVHDLMALATGFLTPNETDSRQL